MFSQYSIGSPSAAEPNEASTPSQRNYSSPQKYCQDIELGQTSIHGVIIVEQMSVNEPPNPQSQKRRWFNLRIRQKRLCFAMSIAWLEVVLATVIYVAGVIAEHDPDWKPLFMALFAFWTLLLVVGVCVDLYDLRNVEFIKRSFCHLGCCILMRYLVSTTKSTAGALPRDLPLIIDCGLGVSIGIQMLPSNIRRDLWRGLNELVGSFCGGVQVRFQGGSSAPGRPRISSDEQ